MTDKPSNERVILDSDGYADIRDPREIFVRRPDETDEQASERRKRLEAINFARASVGLSGFKPSPECEALAERFINGEIGLSEAIGVVKAQESAKD